MIQRRSFLFGIGAALAAPAIVRASSLMPVKALRPSFNPWIKVGGQTSFILPRITSLSRSFIFTNLSEGDVFISPGQYLVTQSNAVTARATDKGWVLDYTDKIITEMKA